MIIAPAGYAIDYTSNDDSEFTVPIVAWADNGWPYVLDENTGYLVSVRDYEANLDPGTVRHGARHQPPA